MARVRGDEEVFVVGLGRFGVAVAAELTSLGNRVTVVERQRERAERSGRGFHRVIVADASDPATLEEAHAGEAASAVVAIGSSVEASVLTAANLVDLGVRSIWAKAGSPNHARILERLGVHKVIFPEAESGRRVAHLLDGRMLDYIEFDDGFAIVKMRPPSELVGFTLGESRVRSKYGVTIVGVKPSKEAFTYATPETKVTNHHEILVSGPVKLIERLANRP